MAKITDVRFRKMTRKYILALGIMGGTLVGTHAYDYMMFLDIKAMLSTQGGGEDYLGFFQNMQFFLLAVEIFVMALTIHFIFRPMMSRIYMQMKALRTAEQNAKDASRLKSEFVATMSHEIRSPMTGVLGMAELLMRSGLDEAQKNYARTIYASGETLLKIIEDVLDFSKIEANRIEIEERPLNLLELVDDICALYYPRAQEKAVELVVRYVPGCEQFFTADAVRIRQVLSNLVSNAIKFTPSGHIIVTVREDKSCSDEDRCMMIISVEDTGIGIPEHMHDAIFDIFTQADSSTTRNFGGTGLGLTISKRLTEMMSGEISLASAPSKGSTFTIRLPLLRDKDIQTPVFFTRPYALQDLRVLVVDDLPIVRKLLNEQFSMIGIRCDLAGSGEQALDKLKDAVHDEDPYKIVIIDYLMPGMNGEMLAAEIKKQSTLRDTCLVMLTATGDPVHYRDVANKGFSACIAKPFKNKDLIEMLADIWTQYNEGQRGKLIRVKSPSHSRPLVPDDSDNLFKGMSVLLVEDSRLNQAYVTEVLEGHGIKITTAAHGGEAVQILQDNPDFDLVLMDCQMPVMDGFEAAAQIRKLKARGSLEKKLPVIALTANAMKGDREKCLEAGMADYLSKPVRADDLKNMVLKWRYGAAEHMAAQAIPEPPAAFGKNEMFDCNALDDVRQAFGSGYENVIEMFLQDSAQYIKTCRQAINRGNYKEAVLPLHTLKSTSARLGLMALSKQAGWMENSSHAGPDPSDPGMRHKMDVDMDRLEKLFGQAYAYLEKDSIKLKKSV